MTDANNRQAAPWIVMAARGAIALVWLYNGLWAKLMERVPHQLSVVEGVPFLSHDGAVIVLKALGLVETALALWVVSGRSARAAAIIQTALLVGMNMAGLIWGIAAIPDPIGMIITNLALLALIWMVATNNGTPAHG